MKKLLSILIALCMYLGASAQDYQPLPSAMESNLKIYVVIAVLVIIFSGIAVFLFTLDRRLRKLEEGK